MNIESNVLIWLAGAIGGGVVSMLHYTWFLSARLSRLEVKIEAHDKFNEVLTQRMVSLVISPNHPDFDRLLLSLRRGDKLNKDDLKTIHGELERMYEELLQSTDPQSNDKKLALALLIALMSEKRFNS